MTSILAVQTLATAKAIVKNTTVYTDSCKFHRCVGDACVWIKHVSVSENLAISQQCSLVGGTVDADWYDPVNSSAAALGVVAAAQAATSGVYIFYTSVPTPYIRFKIIAANTNDTVLDLKLIFREEV